MTMYADKALRCVTCGNDFVFTAGEQEFHATKGFTNEPRRCQPCRRARRADTRETVPARGAGEANASEGHQTRLATAPRSARPESGRSGAAATAASPQQFASTCSACGGEATLPFEPVGNRAVLCSTCYDKIRAFA